MYLCQLLKQKTPRLFLVAILKLFMVASFKILLLLNFYEKELNTFICVFNPPQLIPHTLFILRKAKVHWNTSAAPGGAAR